MKILFPYMARWYSLNWSRYHSLLTALAQRGHEVHVMQPPSMPSAETNFVEIAPVPIPGLKVHDVPVPAWLWQRKFPLDKLVKKALYSLYSVRYARRLARSEHITHVLLYNIPQAPLARIPGVSTVFDYADDYMDMLRYELGRFSIRPLMALAQGLLNHMFRSASLVTTVSHVLGDQVHGAVQVLPNGVSMNKVRAADGVGPEGGPQRRPVVGFLGSFEYFIDFDLILDTASQLPDVDFVLVGRGRDHAYVESEVARRQLANVKLTGGVPHAEVFHHIARMDICLNIFKKIPVSERACPIKLFEYAAMRKPIVSTRLAELKHVDKGFLYYADTADEAVAAIQRILQAPEEAMQRALAGCQHTVTHYTWDKIALDFERAVGETLPVATPGVAPARS
ncbi:glycosyltransferase family protein [Ideonella sp. BN130291]|uniref:glycosyltransferase family protein n=1 Tax=Ideonella sp. BN130291 TaxID=3112940 RepID=UPI002E2709EE|nr:glycosyltransferase [Ideonella sp. BN130291]